MLYRLWGIAENAELMAWRPRKFWWWLQRLCARHYGFGKQSAQQARAVDCAPGRLRIIIHRIRVLLFSMFWSRKTRNR